MRLASLRALRKIDLRKRFCDSQYLHREVDAIPENQRFLRIVDRSTSLFEIIWWFLWIRHHFRPDHREIGCKRIISEALQQLPPDSLATELLIYLEVPVHPSIRMVWTFALAKAIPCKASTRTGSSGQILIVE